MRTPINFLFAALLASAAAAAPEPGRPTRNGVTPSTVPTTSAPGGGDTWPDRPKDFNVVRPNNATPPKPGQFSFEPAAEDPRLVRILVATYPFIWSIVYPGPDGKLGRYFTYPKVSDAKWPELLPGDEFEFPDVPGPAAMPEENAKAVLTRYIQDINPLGKDLSDPAGRDDDWRFAIGRRLYVPKGKPVEISFVGTEVLKALQFPGHRVETDVAPGAAQKMYLTAAVTSAEFENPTRKKHPLEEWERLLKAKDAPSYVLEIPPDDPRGVDVGEPGTPEHFRRYEREVTVRRRIRGRMENVKEKHTIATHGLELERFEFADLREAGIKELWAYAPMHWDVASEHLDRFGTYRVHTQLVVLDEKEFERRFLSPPRQMP